MGPGRGGVDLGENWASRDHPSSGFKPNDTAKDMTRQALKPAHGGDGCPHLRWWRAIWAPLQPLCASSLATLNSGVSTK